MTQFLVTRTLWQDTLLSGLATSAIQSSAIYFGRDVVRGESLMFACSSTLSTPDVAFFYAESPDGVTFGSYADNTALLTSTVSLANPQGWHTVALPTFLAPYIKFAASSTGSNPVDTRIWATLLLRME